MKNNSKFLTVNIDMDAKPTRKGADKALNKFGWAAIILASGIALAAIIAATGMVLK